MRKGRLLREERGVTLVEIAVVIAMIGIVAMLAVPNIMGVIPRMQLASDTTTLANTIAMARASAISKNQYFGLAFDDSADSYSSVTWNVDRDDADSDKVADWNEYRAAFTNTMSANVDLYNIENLGSNNSLLAEPVGTIGRVDGGSREDFPLGTVGRIYLKTVDGLYEKRVIVDGMGKVKVEHKAPGVTTWTEE